MVRPSKSISGARPVTRSAPRGRAGAHGPAQGAVAGGQMQVVIAARPEDRRPIGVLGRRPHQKVASETLRHREQVGDHMLQRLAALVVQGEIEAASSAVPPTRRRSPRRVTATLWASSMTVDSGAPEASVMGMVSE